MYSTSNLFELVHLQMKRWRLAKLEPQFHQTIETSKNDRKLTETIRKSYFMVIY
jgi:hypothetical protein